MDKQNRQKMVDERIAWSAEYVKKAEPIISDLLRGGYILRVEGKQEEVCKALDIVCGTDYVYLYPERHHAWGVACRVQKYDYANFTVRRPRNPAQKRNWINADTLYAIVGFIHI